MAKLLKSNGEILQNVDISTLKKMQDLVGGLIEFVYLKDNQGLLVANEEGLLNDLPHNQKASSIYGRPLVGDVIQCGLAEVNL